MLAPLTPGDDPRLAPLLDRLSGLGVPVLPLDYARIARVFAPGRQLGWAATRELLVTLLAKDEEQRRTVRREFKRQLPPVEEEPPPSGDGDLAPAPGTPAPGTAPDLAGDRPTNQPPAATKTPRIRWSRPQRRWPVWGIALGGSLALILIALLLALPRFAEGPAPEVPPPPPAETAVPPPPGELPSQPLAYFHDWVPVLEPLRPAAALAAWLPPVALLIGALLAIAWLWERSRALREPRYEQIAFNPDAEPVFAWSPADLRLPGLLSASQRREMVWGVQRFESERTRPRLDVAGTVRASAAAGLPELRFAPARYEREVWLWLDSHLRLREAVALADQVERDLTRAGLRVRRATFPAIPDKIRFVTRERASPLDLGSAARQALVALFSDGAGIARTLRRGNAERAVELQRILRELKTWPRLCLVDFSPPDLDLPALAERFGLACIGPDQLPGWLAERPPRGGDDDAPAVSDFAVRLWAAACALPHMPVTAPQTRALYQRLALPPAWRLPAPEAGQAGADGIRFSDGEGQHLLADLAGWVWEDGRGSQAGACLAAALAFWDDRLAGAAEDLRQLTPDPPSDWDNGGGDHAQAVERLLLHLWRGDSRTAEAVRALYDLYQQPALARQIRVRLGALSARGLARPQDAGRIILPWLWRRLPEAAGEPPGTARQRLLRMGLGGAKPGGRRTLGADTRLLLGAFAGVALAGLVGLGQRIAALDDTTVSHDAAVHESPLFQSLVMEQEYAGRLHAASRKLTVSRKRLPGEDLRVHWCWSGVPEDQVPEPCRELFDDRRDPRRVNLVRTGDSALLRAGSLAEPIRACAEGWPELSVAVIAADPWSWPQDPEKDKAAHEAWSWPEDPDNKAARQLAIRLLDSGAADLALFGPDWAEQARRLGDQWAFVADSQWLFFSPLPPGEGPGVRAIADRVPDLGAHRALIRADYAGLAAYLRDSVNGVLDPKGLPPDVARIETLTGNPRLWGGPEVTTNPAGVEFVQVCPGTFTMGSPQARPETPEHLIPYDQELPAHPVILDGFEMARTETTWDQLALLRPAAVDNSANQGGNWPAAYIHWENARAACRALDEREDVRGQRTDLPTEAQWEYAARGGAQTPYPFASELETLCEYANGAGNEYPYGTSKNKACSDPYWEAAPVGRFPPNASGLHDMHGNVWEWARDCYDGKAYARRGPHPTPSPIEDRLGCERRVLRGGSFRHEPWDLRSAVRGRHGPERRRAAVGFRCVRGSGRQLVD